jgi:hypothetical protein
MTVARYTHTSHTPARTAARTVPGHAPALVPHEQATRTSVGATPPATANKRSIAPPTTYSPGQAVLPALWGHTTSGTADPNAVQALAQRQSTDFLAKMAVSQAAAGAAAAAAAAAGPSRGPRPRPPAMTDDDLAAIYRQPWMQPSPPRALPAERAALRQGLAAGQTLNAAGRDDALDPLATRAVSPGGPVWRSAWARVTGWGKAVLKWHNRGWF